MTETPDFARKPAVHEEFELVVVGGGLSGLCAAIAAARGGVETAIVQERPVFGGNSSSEVRVVPFGAASGAAWGAETGIVHELLLADRATNHEWLFDHGMANALYDMTLEEAARQEPQLTTFFNTSIRGVAVEALPVEDGESATGYEKRITALHGSQLGTEKEFVFRARHVLDATGDGSVGALAGAEQRYGREARHEFGEPLAPLQADDTTLGATIPMRARKIDVPAPYTPPEWAASYTSPEDFTHDRQLYHIEKDNFGGYWWLEVNNPYHQIDDNLEVRHQLHRHVLGVWNYLKNHSPEKERFAHYVLDWIGMIPGKRESRRLVGDVTVTEHDCHVDRRWPDGVAYASWWIDLHIKGGINNKTDPAERENIDKRYSDYIRVVPFSLPLRAYYSRNVENLWMAGRILSVSHVGLGPVRVMLSLGAQGQAVGAAAAYAIEHGLTPRQTADPDGEHIAAVRQRLIRQDARLLGVRNGDPDDLATTARVSASSASALRFPDPETLRADQVRWVDLATDRAQVLPLTADALDSVAVYVRSTRTDATEVEVAVEELDRIWDRSHGKPVSTGRITVPAGFEGWLDLPVQAVVTPDTPHRIILRATDGVAWAMATGTPSALSWGAARTGPIGTVAQYLCQSPGGPEERHAGLRGFSLDEIDLPSYELWRQYRKGSHAVRLHPVPQPYEARYATNGAAWVEELPNLWLSEPVTAQQPQWLQLDWDAPVGVTSVEVSFDTELDVDTRQRPAFYRAPQCAEHWRLSVRSGDGYRTVHEERSNHQRKRVVRLTEPVTTDSLRLEVLATNGVDKSVGVYEIRAYGS